MLRKIYISATALLCLLALSCARELEGLLPQEQGGPEAVAGRHPVFSASTEKAAQLRAGLDGHSVVWAAGDEISISDGNGHTAVYSASSAGSETDFTYKSGDALDSGSGVIYTAWYPKEAASGYSGCSQTYIEGGIHDIPMKAVGSGTNLQFKNLAGIVKISLTGAYDNICAVLLGAEKPLGGFFDASLTPGQAAAFSGAGSVQITIPAGEGRDISGGRDFFFSVAEGTYSNFSLTVLNADGGLACFSGSGVRVERSAISTIDPITVELMGLSGTRDLSSAGRANCYIVPGKGDYSFRADVKGNSSSAISPVSAEILWSADASGSSNSGFHPAVLYGGRVYFRKDGLSGAFVPANAVAAVRDASGTVLWSWHLWAVGAPSSSDWANVAGTMMDRNLGALGATAGASGNGGLLYQWGRKDPFPAEIPESFPAAVASSAAVGTLSYAVAHPNQWIYGIPETCYDWFYGVQDASVWDNGGAKGLYDPCPPGWRIPDGGGHGISSSSRGPTVISLSGFWNKAFGTGTGFFGRSADGTLWWDTAGRGLRVPSSVAGRSTWLPATGHIPAEGGPLEAKGSEGSIWTRTCEPVMSSLAACAICMDFGASGRVNPYALSGRAAGRSVRCVKI